MAYSKISLLSVVFKLRFKALKLVTLADDLSKAIVIKNVVDWFF